MRAGREALAASRCDGFAAPPTKSGKPCQICESRRWDEREETIFNKVPRKSTMTNDERETRMSERETRVSERETRVSAPASTCFSAV